MENKNKNVLKGVLCIVGGVAIIVAVILAAMSQY